MRYALMHLPTKAVIAAMNVDKSQSGLERVTRTDRPLRSESPRLWQFVLTDATLCTSTCLCSYPSRVLKQSLSSNTLMIGVGNRDYHYLSHSEIRWDILGCRT